MAWIAFKLGRPGAELTFSLNPAGLSITDGNIKVVHRNLEGDLRKSVIKAGLPTIGINSNYFTKVERDLFVSLLNITDSFLSFQLRDDWKMLKEKNTPSDVSTVRIQNSSITKLDEALIAAGATGQITINKVYDNPAGTGVDYYAGGSFHAATRTITLGTPLAAVVPVYVDYTYKGLLVDFEALTYSAEGGWVDRFNYDFQFVGV